MLADHCSAEFAVPAEASSAALDTALAAVSQNNFAVACTQAQAAAQAETQMNAIATRPGCIHDNKKRHVQLTSAARMARDIRALQATAPPAKRDATGSSLAPGTTNQTDTTDRGRAKQ